tara:strand:- start:1108 stop:1821 length:714 start_codon:yes stop_codon:yes gene_type:complete
MTFKATYLGSNGWIIDFSSTRIIIDPWLIGDLVFPPGEWFFKGSLEKEVPTPQNIDLVLLTQGLPDHCHIPTLKKFPKSIDIICPKSALKTLEDLGFECIKVIEPNQFMKYNDIDIEATSGAPVPQIENGYILESKEGSFYIEPHGFLDDKIISRELDAVITPTKNLELPLIGPFVKGAEVIPQLIKMFSPKYILSSTTGGDAIFSGFLNKFISLEEFKDKFNCKIIDLKTMQSIEI